jgi:hypothetical protein
MDGQLPFDRANISVVTFDDITWSRQETRRRWVPPEATMMRPSRNSLREMRRLDEAQALVDEGP